MPTRARRWRRLQSTRTSDPLYFGTKKRTMIGIALMGAGRMARVHASAIGAAGGKLVIVYDVVESAANSLAADFGASVAHSAQER